MTEVVSIYYENDQVVEEDQELQDFVKDVYVYGMRGRKASGRLPQVSTSIAGPVSLKVVRNRRQETLCLQGYPPPKCLPLGS